MNNGRSIGVGYLSTKSFEHAIVLNSHVEEILDPNEFQTTNLERVFLTKMSVMVMFENERVPFPVFNSAICVVDGRTYDMD